MQRHVVQDHDARVPPGDVENPSVLGGVVAEVVEDGVEGIELQECLRLEADVTDPDVRGKSIGLPISEHAHLTGLCHRGRHRSTVLDNRRVPRNRREPGELQAVSSSTT